MQSIRQLLKVLLNLSIGTCGRRFPRAFRRTFSRDYHRSFSAKSKSRIASVLRGNTVLLVCLIATTTKTTEKRKWKKWHKYKKQDEILNV